jgi:very-short-patch-repair endonuclease
MAKVIKNEAGILLEMHLGELGLTFRKEHRFHPERKWRFDYLLYPGKVAIEVEGGVFAQSRHVRGVGYQKDLEKYNHAAIMGFTVLRFSTGQVLDGTAREFIAKHCK